ncbi:tripartite tricarboxylate transporter substrate-binding protein [Saccharopolyspora sp. NFXS83]|uniref:Bug family tripartite tricarboxylate transporter substrate binding protein n=1 Tax=Saccharopolyspora sp. NFXS83 TaxID=2993560 RepID=UPI00224B445B|nr:tripartite tricarboxylate transporter substrate-binding protein [Saccharopolyspora sp. NFXS83]MCX2731462.1 tripartite tricarboxylate transporter substrate-binding protein [Saccharopolyspora sp. NFXS83]
MTAGRFTGRLGAAVLSLVLVGTGVASAYESARSGTGLRDKLKIVAPAAPGGGWDTTARELQHAAQENGLTGSSEVLNVEGAGGTIGLARTVNQPGDPNTLLLTGTTMLGAVEINGSPNQVTDTTPIAKITQDYDAIVVPATSPLRTTGDLMQRWATDPGGVVVGGGSIGSLDHLLAGSAASAAGVGPAGLNYIAYSGGGEMVAALLGGHLDVGVANTNEISDQVTAGELRVLGVSSPQRTVDLPDAPTLRESGYDIVMSNWRGLAAAPGITPEQADDMRGFVRRLVATPQWREALLRNNWLNGFEDGPAFDRTLGAETERIRDITERLGLA